jgi:predicted nucleotidyltransferase component of viral defense system
MLTKYALERFLYRISISPYADQFLLKGALLFDLWFAIPRRPTRDADFLGLEERGGEEMAKVFSDICSCACDDGMLYSAESVTAIEIREDDRYGGLRVELMGFLGSARCGVQVDIGFGDAVTPEPSVASFPLLLPDNPAPVLKVYPKETAIAEKLEAIVSLGMANSRMKDYFDLHILFSESVLDVTVLGKAVRRTFDRRQTDLPVEVPAGLSEDFARASGKKMQWRAFLSKNSLEAPSLEAVTAGICASAMELFILASR